MATIPVPPPDAPSAPPILEARALGHAYGRAGDEVVAVADLTFAIPTGQFACIIGPSGCGKTTVLRCLSGLLSPRAGAATMDGEEITAPPRGMAVVFQEYGRSLFPWKTVRANVELPLRSEGVPKDERAARVDRALRAVGLEGRARAFPWQLSGGMQQRVAIARAVVARPKVLVMDEPFGAVDAQTRADLEDLVRDLWRDLDMTVVFVTHDIDEAIYVGERVLVLGPSPRSLRADLAIDLPRDRDQVGTRALPRFSEYRAVLHREITLARA